MHVESCQFSLQSHESMCAHSSRTLAVVTCFCAYYRIENTDYEEAEQEADAPQIPERSGEKMINQTFQNSNTCKRRWTNNRAAVFTMAATWTMGHAVSESARQTYQVTEGDARKDTTKVP